MTRQTTSTAAPTLGVFTVRDDKMGPLMPAGATLTTREVRAFEGEGIYVLLFGGELEARRVSEGVHGEKDSRLVMTFDGARADPVSITRARFAKYVYAKAVAVQINLWPAGLQHHG
jgi:hypothetical protein